MLMSRYKVSVKEEPQFAGETFEERKARVLRSKPGLTMTCVPFSISLHLFMSRKGMLTGALFLAVVDAVRFMYR